MESAFRMQYFDDLKKEEEEMLAKNSNLIQSFCSFASSKGIELSRDNFHYSHTKGITAEYPELLALLFPSIETDKEGLYDFEQLTKQYKRAFFSPGYLDAGNCWLMAHPYFRRGFHPINNWAPRFIDEFWNLNEPGIESFISLDPDRLKIDIDGASYRELDTWFGAKFDKDIATVPDGIVHIRPPAYLTEGEIYYWFASAHSLDIQWGTKPGIRIFEAEEFKTKEVTIEKNGVKYYPVRYLHAEYDLATKSFRHFDGAIHFYTEEEYVLRCGTDMNYNVKNTRQIKTLSQKLFKFNGNISTEIWIEFASQFFTHNPLVFEYFEGRYPDYLLGKLELMKKKSELNPYGAGDLGLR